MKIKTFKLNRLQWIIIPYNHPAYNEVLAAIIANQSITSKVAKYLIKKGLQRVPEPTPGWGIMWHDPIEVIYPGTIKL